jgi:anti-sigma factor RsiW
MFQRHVARKLAALIDGQLSRAETARVNAHLAVCARCRDAHDRVQFTSAALGQLRLVKAPASIWTSLQTALAGGSIGDSASDPQGAVLSWYSDRRRVLALAAMVVIATVTVALWQIGQRPARWEVVRLDRLGGEVRMAVGEWVETGAGSRARVRIGNIGTVDVAPNTRVQVLAARPGEHRLSLPQGSISAEIVAPPRLFFVETPSSTVVDLGCAYTMDVDQAGGLLRVTSGWASLEWGGRESVVPAGASCPTRPEVGPGTPSFDDTPDALRQALLTFDFHNGGARALDVVLAEARARDTLTLWHLLSRVEPAERARVFDRIVELAPLPAGVTRDRALALDAETLKLWREELAWSW